MTAARNLVGVLGFDGVTALDVAGPLEALGAARIEDPCGKSYPAYRTIAIGLTKKTFRSETGLRFIADYTLATAPPLDTVIVPGGSGLRGSGQDLIVSRWIARKADGIRRIVSVCTGIYGLAPSGLLDGRRVTTHWRFARDVAMKFPKLRLEADAIFLKDGKFYTSAGISAGIDLALALVEEDYGPACALAAARVLVMYLTRPGGQEQFSEPLQFQIRATDRLGDAVAWARSNLHRGLTSDVLARKACLSLRHFNRRFKHGFGSSPAAFIERLRLDEARTRLVDGTQTVQEIAKAVGFNSDDSFRRSFERHFGLAPTSYRTQFRKRGNE